VRRLIALVPPARLHLTSFHGVLAPNASLRPLATRQPEAEAAPGPPAKVSPKKKTKRRLDWATLHQRTSAPTCCGALAVAPVPFGRSTQPAARQSRDSLTLASPSPRAFSRLKAEMQRRRHQPIPEQGRRLGSVVRGHIAYFGVPTNAPRLDFCHSPKRAFFDAFGRATCVDWVAQLEANSAEKTAHRLALQWGTTVPRFRRSTRSGPTWRRYLRSRCRW
jgi:hypothetical protein